MTFCLLFYVMWDKNSNLQGNVSFFLKSLDYLSWVLANSVPTGREAATITDVWKCSPDGPYTEFTKSSQDSMETGKAEGKSRMVSI